MVDGGRLASAAEDSTGRGVDRQDYRKADRHHQQGRIDAGPGLAASPCQGVPERLDFLIDEER